MDILSIRTIGEANIPVITNKVTSTNTLELYTINLLNGTITINPLPTAGVVITNISIDLVRCYIDAPNYDCYLLIIFNSVYKMIRVGTPKTLILIRRSPSIVAVNYQMLNLDGEVLNGGVMTNAALDLSYVEFNHVGSVIFKIPKTPPAVYQNNYNLNTIGLSQVIFPKNEWFLIAIPESNKRISDVVTSLSDKYGIVIRDMFSVLTSVSPNDTKAAMDYVPGITPIDTKYNFNLIDVGDGKNTPMGIWCKTKSYDIPGSPNELMVYEW